MILNIPLEKCLTFTLRSFQRIYSGDGTLECSFGSVHIQIVAPCSYTLTRSLTGTLRSLLVDLIRPLYKLGQYGHSVLEYFHKACMQSRFLLTLGQLHVKYTGTYDHGHGNVVLIDTDLALGRIKFYHLGLTLEEYLGVTSQYPD